MFFAPQLLHTLHMLLLSLCDWNGTERNESWVVHETLRQVRNLLGKTTKMTLDKRSLLMVKGTHVQQIHPKVMLKGSHVQKIHPQVM